MQQGFGRAVAAALVLAAAGAWGSEVARIGAVVLDAETRRPLAGIEMKGHFSTDNGWEASKGAAEPNFVTVYTDREGRCTASARTNKGEAGWHVASVPKGYYRPSHGGWFTFRRKGLFGDWTPDNLVSTVLVQRVGHPIPLVGKCVHADCAEPAPADLIGKAGGRLAYDLLRGDWLPPVGRGETADVVFERLAAEELGTGEDKLFARTGRAYRQRVTMRFPGADNGLVELTPPSGSVPMVRAAPESGYGPGLDFEYGRDTSLGEINRNHLGKVFAFRIRARRDGQGRLVEAHYGKIYGGVEIARACGEKAGTLVDLGEPRFGYLVNPASLDRNLEWDLKGPLEWDFAAHRYLVPSLAGRKSWAPKVLVAP